MIVHFTEQVLWDIQHTEKRLESEHTGYGKVFSSLLREATDAVEFSPYQYSLTEDNPTTLQIREFYIKRFQYRLIYSISETELVYLALVHARQRPGTWAQSLNDDDKPLT